MGPALLQYFPLLHAACGALSPHSVEAWDLDERCQLWREACHTLRHSAALPAALLLDALREAAAPAPPNHNCLSSGLTLGSRAASELGRPANRRGPRLHPRWNAGSLPTSQSALTQLRGTLRFALRTGLEHAVAGAGPHDEGGWKLFFLAPRMRCARQARAASRGLPPRRMALPPTSRLLLHTRAACLALSKQIRKKNTAF